MEKVTIQKLESTLWKAADILRGELNAAEYKDYIFGMLFLKRMNDVFVAEREKKKNSFLSKGITKSEVNEIIERPTIYEAFYIPKEARWEKLKDLNLNIGPQLDKAFRAIEDEPTNSELKGVLTALNYTTKALISDKEIYELFQIFNDIGPLVDKNLDNKDTIGTAFECLLDKFAKKEGIRGGESYTPTEVVKLLVEILKPQDGNRIYDPTVGSGGMLIQAMRYVKEHYQNWKNISLYGQEINISTWAICKMNMLAHNVKGADIRKGDTLRNPQHIEDGVLKTFDIVIANPPFGLRNWGIEVAESDIYNRFTYGIPPKSFGDLAFVSHMVASLNSKGGMGTVIPHGVLFRGGAESKIREGFIKDDLIEAIIGLPPNVFFGTGIPTALIIINKNKAPEKKNKILFIDASDGFEKKGNINQLREQDLKKIVKTFDNNQDIDKYAKVIDLKEIKENDFRLNINRYLSKSLEYNLGKVDFDYKILNLKDIAEISIGKKSKKTKIALNKTTGKVFFLDADYRISEGNNFFISPKIEINSYYLYLYMNSIIGREALMRVRKGGVIPYITKDDLKNIPIILPNIDVQNSISSDAINILKSLAELEVLINDGKDAIKEKLFNLKEIKSSLKTFTKKSQEVYYKSLPFPIAITYRKMSNARGGIERFNFLIDLFEVSVKFLALINLSDYFNKLKNKKNLFNEIPIINIFRNPTLGVWIRLLRELFKLKSSPGSKPFVEEIKKFEIDKYETTLNDFGTIRNNLRGHGITISNQEYEAKFQEYFPKLNELLESMQFLTNYTLAATDSIEYKNKKFGIVLRELMGDNPQFERKVINSTKPIETEKIVYINARYDYLILNPFIILEICPTCQRPELLLLDKLNKKKVTYLSYECGHKPSFPNEGLLSF